MRTLSQTAICLFLTLMSGHALATVDHNKTAKAVIHEHWLENGMRIIVQEDHRAPAVVHMVWYQVGSIDEIDGQSGLAHYLEHMMFAGTPKISGDAFTNTVLGSGGQSNAFTSYDYTAYFQRIPRDALQTMMTIESDRMRHLLLEEEKANKELKVVQEERRLRTDDQPESLLFEALAATAFQTHPYRRPIIGWMDDLNHLDVNALQQWYHTWYAPNNAILVVVGDVDHNEVLKMAQQTYGKVGVNADFSRRRIPAEAPQRGPRQVTVRANTSLPMVIMAYKAPQLTNPTKDSAPYALAVLASILDGYSAARLPRQLVREQSLAVSVGAGYDMIGRGPSLFYIYGKPRPGVKPETLKQALTQQLQDIIINGVSIEEIDRVKRMLIAERVYERDSMFGQAMEIGRLVTAKLKPEDRDQIIDKLRAVDQAAIQAAAKKWLVNDQLTVGILEPSAEKKSPRPRPANIAVKH